MSTTDKGFATRLKEALLPAFMMQFNVASNERDIPTEKLGEVIQGIFTKGILNVLAKG